jgi:hypothetical protein
MLALESRALSKRPIGSRDEAIGSKRKAPSHEIWTQGSLATANQNFAKIALTPDDAAAPCACLTPM